MATQAPASSCSPAQNAARPTLINHGPRTNKWVALTFDADMTQAIGTCYGLPAVRSRARKRAEVLQTEAIIKRVAGVTPRYFRFPGGCLTSADVRLVASLGEQPVQWDVISGDSFLTDPARVEEKVLRQVRPGSIVVMHLVGPARTPATAPVVRYLIPKLRARGYRFVTLRKLLTQP